MADGCVLAFMDQDININKTRAMELYETLGRHPGKLDYGIMTSLLCLDEEIIGTLSRTGCSSCFLGIESGSKEVLENVGRTFDLGRTRAILKALDKTNIYMVCAFMVGFPSEDRKAIAETRKLIRTLPMDFSFASLVNPFPGTDLYQLALKEKWITPESYMKPPKKMFYPHIPTYHLTREQVRREFLLCNLACYLRPSFFWHFFRTLLTRPRRTQMMVLSLIGQVELAMRMLAYNIKMKLNKAGAGE